MAAPLFALLLAAAAAASPLPKEVKLVDGAFRTQANAPLYKYKNDTMFGMSHCFAACAVAWPPLLASPQAQPSPDWTLIPREGGAKQWAYKDKPLYTANIPIERVEAALKPDGMWVPAKP